MHKPYGAYEKYVKRFIDIMCSMFVIIFFGWLFIIIAFLVKFKLGSPVIFKQARPGKNGKIFNLYKFRTMTDDRDERGELLPDDQRLTSFGKWLRSTSLDELPEVFCILFGTMSIVGPRPLAIEYLPYYNMYEMRRHDVRPGLTGLAQVQGRNSVNWDERFAYDIEYVDNITFLNDVRIILLTIKAVIKKNGIEDCGSFTLQDFDVYRKNQIKRGE
nr:sugar transferase [uncultured Blautia sp.]